MEQLFEQYQELEKRNSEELEHDKSITHLLYIEGFKWDDIEKIKKINKISQTKIDKRITLVQDVLQLLMQFGGLRKEVEQYAPDNENCYKLLKDIDMHINSIMFEIDKLEQLRQKSSRFLRLQSQPNIKPETAPTDVMAQTGGLISSTSDGQSKLYRSSFQFYRAQRDQQIQSHNQKWIEKQYSIQNKWIEDEMGFAMFKIDVEAKQHKAEANLEEYQKWQKRQLEEQELKNTIRLQTHKERMLMDQKQRQEILESKMAKKEQQLKKQMSLLQEFYQEQKQTKEEHFQKIIQKSQGALMDKTKFNQLQKEQQDKKVIENNRKLRYIEESKGWTKEQLRKQQEIKQQKIEKANRILEEQDRDRRLKFDDKEQKHLAYVNKYDKLFQEYQDKVIKEKEDKIRSFQLQKAVEDASREQVIKYQFERRSHSQAQAQRLKERRLKILQEEKAGEHLLKQLEINQRLQLLEQEQEMKRIRQQQLEEEQRQRKLQIENDERQIMREREINARKLEIEREQKEKQIKNIKYSKA